MKIRKGKSLCAILEYNQDVEVSPLGHPAKQQKHQGVIESQALGASHDVMRRYVIKQNLNYGLLMEHASETKEHMTANWLGKPLTSSKLFNRHSFLEKKYSHVGTEKRYARPKRKI